MKAIKIQIQKHSQWLAILLAAVVAIITSAVVANATQTVMPNQALERSAAQRMFTLKMIKTFSVEAKLYLPQYYRCFLAA